MKKLFFQKSHTKIISLIFIFIILGGFLFFGNAHIAHAGIAGFVVDGLLQAVLYLCGFLLSMANTIFGWCIDTANMDLLTNGPAIYESWKLIRDLLNISFILVLLYTAFTIIFQVDSSNKKIILTLVLMALLVNFSFPIARFIIDISNTLMYTIIKTMGLAKGFGTLTESTSMTALLHPQNPSTETLLASVVFSFIFAFTLAATGLLLIVRMIALAILIIFSPIAFVATILPGTSSYASKWWTNLFNYALFGPVMMLMLYIATSLMTGFSKFNTLGKFQTLGVANGADATFIGAMAYMSIPVVLLWIGMGTAQSMSVAGAGAIMGQAQKVGKWAGMKFSGARFATDTYKAYRTRRDQAKEDSWSKKLGTFVGSQQDRLRGNVIGGKDAELRYQKDLMAKVKKEGERNDTVNMATHDLQNLAKNGNNFEKAAAIQELANRSQATKTELDAMRKTFGDTGQVFRQLQAKVKTYDPVAAFSHLSPADQERNFDDFIKSNQFDVKKIGTDSLANERFMEAMFENKAISTKDIADISKTSAGKKRAMDISLSNLVARRNVAGDAVDNNINMAYFAQTGKIETDTFAGHIGKNLDKDTSANMNWAKLSATQRRDIATNVKRNQIKNIADGVRDDKSARNFVRHMRYAGHREYIEGSPALKNF